MKKISCIIPFYNESYKPIHVVESVMKLKPMPQIIAVDDGSENQFTYKKLLQKFPDIDMIILRRVADKTAAIIPWLRDDIVLSGQRILKTEDLREVFDRKIDGYKLESYINRYMMEKKKKVFWMPFSVQNIHKQHKWGYWEGMKIGIPGFIQYMFSFTMVRQILYFCKEEAV